MEAHLQQLEEIMKRSRREEEGIQFDTKTAAANIIEYLRINNLIKQPEKKEPRRE